MSTWRTIVTSSGSALNSGSVRFLSASLIVRQRPKLRWSALTCDRLPAEASPIRPVCGATEAASSSLSSSFIPIVKLSASKNLPGQKSDASLSWLRSTSAVDSAGTAACAFSLSATMYMRRSVSGLSAMRRSSCHDDGTRETSRSATLMPSSW